MKKNTFLVLGIVGISLVVVYVLVSIFAKPRQDLSQNLKYSNFYQLMNKLDYKVKILSPDYNVLPEGILVYLDFDMDKQSNFTVLLESAKEGREIYLLGIKQNADPLSGVDFKRSTESRYKVKGLSGSKYGKMTWPRMMVNTNPYQESKFLYNETGSLVYYKNYSPGKLWVMTDSSLIENENILETNAAIIVNQMFKPHHKKSIFIVLAQPSDLPPQNFFRSLFEGNMLFISVYLLAMFALFALWKGRRFKNTQQYQPYKMHSTLQHIKGVSQFFQKTQSLEVMDEINEQYFQNQDSINRYMNYMTHQNQGALSPEKQEQFDVIHSVLDDSKVTTMEELFKKEKRKDRCIKILSAKKE